MDAVLAIAITLPVTELHAPEPTDGDLAAAYLKLAPEYAAYALSVVLISLYWAHSHFSGKLLENRSRLQSARHWLSGCRQHHSISRAPVGRTPQRRCGEYHRRPLVSGRSSDTGDLVVSSLGIRHRERSSRPTPDGRLPQANNPQIRHHCRSLLGFLRFGFLGLACWTYRRGDRYVELYRSASKTHLQAGSRTGEWLRPAIDPARRMPTSANQPKILSIVIGRDRTRLPVA